MASNNGNSWGSGSIQRQYLMSYLKDLIPKAPPHIIRDVAEQVRQGAPIGDIKRHVNSAMQGNVAPPLSSADAGYVLSLFQTQDPTRGVVPTVDAALGAIEKNLPPSGVMHAVNETLARLYPALPSAAPHTNPTTSTSPGMGNPSAPVEKAGFWKSVGNLFRGAEKMSTGNMAVTVLGAGAVIHGAAGIVQTDEETGKKRVSFVRVAETLMGAAAAGLTIFGHMKARETGEAGNAITGAKAVGEFTKNLLTSRRGATPAMGGPGL